MQEGLEDFAAEPVEFNQLAPEKVPKKTVKAYKLFRTDPRRPGELFPLFVDAKTSVPVGEWIEAADVYYFIGDNGLPYVPAETGRNLAIPNDQVRQELFDRGLIKSLETKAIRAVAYRPGWHAGDLPFSKHIGGKSQRGLPQPDYRPDNHVWAEVELPADHDWQTEAHARARRDEAGNIIPGTAQITDQIPVGGHYRYKTNPNMAGEWMIGGAMRINRILSDDEVKAINDAAGVADLPRRSSLNQSFAGMSARAREIVDSLGINALDESVAPSDYLYSTRTWNQEEKAQINELARELGISEEKVAKWMYDIDNAMARVLANPGTLDFFSEAADLYTALKPNSDPHYTVSLDFSTLCRKRYELMATIEAIQNMTGRALTKETWVEVRSQLKKLGYTVSCGACYVDSKRMEAGKFVNEFIDAHPEEDPKQFLSQAGIDKLKRDKPKLYAEFQKKLGSNNAKTPESRTDYKGEIREYFIASSAGKKRTAEMNRKSGLRWQSWSDFEVPHLLDAMQAILDMHMAGLMGHAYTKVPEFVLAMGKTGLMCNMSLIPKGTGLDKKGRLVFDGREGMPFDVALDLREKHEMTAGTIAIGVSDAHIKALLADPRIDYVIPYHASGLSKEIAKKFNMDGWDDYSDTQTEDIGDPELFHKTVGKEHPKLANLWSKVENPAEWAKGELNNAKKRQKDLSKDPSKAKKDEPAKLKARIKKLNDSPNPSSRLTRGGR